MTIVNIELLDKKIEEMIPIYLGEIDNFSNIGQQFLNNEITGAAFKAVSGGMGVYAQKGGKEFMLRLRTLSGVLDYETLKLVQKYVHKYSLDFIHLTTRQTIQLHNLDFDHVIHIMKESLKHTLITRGGGGNYPRNVSLSPLSGVEKGEAFDVTPYAILVNKYFLTQINSYNLPRKFKVAFSSHVTDSANASIADLGFIAVNKDGENYFKLYLGGSLGVNSAVAITYDELVSPKDILYYVEAMLHLFQAEGDYNNKSKARIRYIVSRLGREAFLSCFKKHLKEVKESLSLDLTPLSKEMPILIDAKEDKSLLDNPIVIPQKQEQLYTIHLHPQGGILKRNHLDTILEFWKEHSNIDIRLGMEENMMIRNLTSVQAKTLMKLTKEFNNVTRLSQSISCIGTPICQIGIQSSQNLLDQILCYFKEKNYRKDTLPSLHISGCVNSCARHQVCELGFQGKKKRVNDQMNDAYTLFIGGATGLDHAGLSKEYGDILAENIPAFLYELALLLEAQNMNLLDYIHTFDKEFTGLLNKFLV